jgi:hypothetical protein
MYADDGRRPITVLGHVRITQCRGSFAPPDPSDDLDPAGLCDLVVAIGKVARTRRG